MKIAKIYNNNIILASDNGREVVVSGSGIGFKKKAGDEVNPESIEKVYELLNVDAQYYIKLLESIPYEFFEYSSYIIQHAGEMGVNVREETVFVLADHINFAYKRYKEGLELPNLVLSETKILYPKEYKVAEHFVNYLNKELGINFKDDEVGFLTMHFINTAASSSDNTLASKLNELLEKANALIYSIYNIKFDSRDEMLGYSRLKTHFKFLLSRILHHDYDKAPVDAFKGIYSSIVQNDNRIEKVINGLSFYIFNQFNYVLDSNEKLYIAIHLGHILEIKNSAERKNTRDDK